MSDNFDKWLERGERLGYTGVDLQEFVQQQQQDFIDREERAFRRAQLQDEEHERKRTLAAQTELEHQKALAERINDAK